MKQPVLYLDCPTGLSGDMLVAALLDCGLEIADWERELKRLALPEWQLESRRVTKNGLAAHKIEFRCPEEHQHRHLSDILPLIQQAGLPAPATALAEKAFHLLAEAEAAAHGCSVEEVHFHEVGAMDAILDICGTALALHQLKVGQVYCAPLPLSGGFVDCAHGRMPVPTPATLNLLQGFELYDSGLMGEIITPTGAALLKALAVRQQKPSFRLAAIGLGAGNRDLPLPNILRACLGEMSSPEEESDQVEVLHCNLDDSTGEMLGYLLPRLLAAGARDACYTPIYMKKGRPAWQLQVIAAPGMADSLAQLIFAESSGIGLRVSRERRITLPRQLRTVDTPYGAVRVKIAGNNIAPEYEDVAAAAEAHHLPFKVVLRQVLALVCGEEEEA